MEWPRTTKAFVSNRAELVGTRKHEITHYSSSCNQRSIFPSKGNLNKYAISYLNQA